MVYNIPALALVWYLLLTHKPLRKWGIRKPGLRDVKTFVLAFPGLFVIGLGFSLLSTLVPGVSAVAELEAPTGPIPWIALALSCLSTGYLEESFFRFYLFRKLENTLPLWASFFMGVILFSFCHFYEGLWGILNAAAAGILLSILFIRFKSLHGIAWAHGAYNAFVYIMTLFNGSLFK